MFWLRNKKNNFQLRTLIWGPVYLCRIFFCHLGRDRYLQVIPSDIISCILQQEETILMLSWSTIKTRQSPSFFDA